MKVSSVAEMRQMDRQAIEQDHIPEVVLMENAGLATVQVMAQHYTLRDRNWLILCGIGNNGGDGLVIARQLLSRAAHVQVALFGDPEKFGEAATLNLEMVQALQIPLLQVSSVVDLTALLDACDGLVDGLLGTGITRPVEGLYADAIAATNLSGKPVVSIDIPSGVNGDTGQVMGCAIRASHTVTYGLPKTGNLLYPGYQLAGQLWVTHIGFAPRLYASPHLQLESNDALALPPREVEGHKGSFGDSLFVAGAGSYYGAPYLSASAAMKAGGGYPRLATPASVAPVVAARAGELVYMPLAETDTGSIALNNKQTILNVANKVDFVVIGPGTSLHVDTQTLMRELVTNVEKPLLIDGDGITAVSRSPELLCKRQGATVLTPHAGEFARLTGMETRAIEADRVAALRKACDDLRAIIVLKGAHSLIGYPDGRVYINLSGNSGMATAGSGDVLTGTIAGIAGLGLTVEQAARMGVFVHGVAGDLAAALKGEDGMIAQDILEALPAALRAWREGKVAHYLLREV